MGAELGKVKTNVNKYDTESIGILLCVVLCLDEK